MTLPILPVCSRAPGRSGGSSNYSPLPAHTHTYIHTQAHWESCHRAWAKLSLPHRQARPAPFPLSPEVNRQQRLFIQTISVCDRSHSCSAITCPGQGSLFSLRTQGMLPAKGREMYVVQSSHLDLSNGEGRVTCIYCFPPCYQPRWLSLSVCTVHLLLLQSNYSKSTPWNKPQMRFLISHTCTWNADSCCKKSCNTS